MSAHVSQNSISLWDPSQGTSLSCTQSRMISFKLKPLVSSKAAESPATRIQVSTSHFRCLSLSVIRRRTIYACQCKCNEMERACSNTRDVRGGRCRSGTPAQSAQPARSRMRRIHFPSKFKALQLCSLCVRPSHLRVAYNGGRRSISTKPDPRTIFSGIQPSGIPHVRFFLTRKLCVALYANPDLSSGITLALSQTGYGCKMPLRLKTGCFSPWLAGTRSHYRKTPVHSWRRAPQ